MQGVLATVCIKTWQDTKKNGVRSNEIVRKDTQEKILLTSVYRLATILESPVARAEFHSSNSARISASVGLPLASAGEANLDAPKPKRFREVELVGIAYASVTSSSLGLLARLRMRGVAAWGTKLVAFVARVIARMKDVNFMLHFEVGQDYDYDSLFL